MSELVHVQLGGALATNFGRHWHLNVRNAKQAFDLIDANKPGFKAWIRKHAKSISKYHIQITNKQGHKYSMDETEFQMMGESDNIAKIRITPVPHGSGGKGFAWFETVVGAALLVASIFIPALAPLGIALLMAGVQGLLSPQAKKAQGPANNSDATYFDGPQTRRIRATRFSLITVKKFSSDLRPCPHQSPLNRPHKGVHGTVQKRKLPEIIAGAGGKKSSGSSRTPVEADDTVNSNVKVSILDLLGEGVIGGLKDGAKSIFLNDLPLQNSDDTYNHSGVTWWFRDGSQDQSIIEGFDYTETPKTIGLQVKKTSAVTMAVDSDSADRFRVILKFPSLKSVDKKTGDTSGTSVTYKFQVSSAGGAFVDVAPEGESSGTVTLTAKKAGVYYRSYMLNLPKPGSKYQVRVVRVTDDNKDTTYLANDIYVDTVGEIINTNMNYPNSALVGLSVNSEQFGSSMPSRSYLISGMKIRVPSNYDEVTNEYRGHGTVRSNCCRPVTRHGFCMTS
jgi:predicted phage tail protein